MIGITAAGGPWGGGVMLLEHEFVVPLPVERAWDLLLDLPRIAPCFPGASVVAVDGDGIQGALKLRIGPISVTYVGSARVVATDAAGRRAVLAASGTEARDSGSAEATIEARLSGAGDSTTVTLSTDLALSGRPAQLGQSVLREAGSSLLARFAESLASAVQAGPEAALAGIAATVGSPEPAARPGPAVTALPARESAPAPPATKAPLLKRVAPLLGGLALLVVVRRALTADRRAAR